MQNENLVKRLLFKLTKKISQKYNFTVVVDRSIFPHNIKSVNFNCIILKTVVHLSLILFVTEK